MRYLHTMIRVSDLDESLDFWVGKVGMVETRRKEVPEGKFTLVFLAAPKDEARAQDENAPELELTYNWDSARRYFRRDIAGRRGAGTARTLGLDAQHRHLVDQRTAP